MAGIGAKQLSRLHPRKSAVRRFRTFAEMGCRWAADPTADLQGGEHIIGEVPIPTRGLNKKHLFDHLVGTRTQRVRHVKPEGFGGLGAAHCAGNAPLCKNSV
jgi:hypothetical protein